MISSLDELSYLARRAVPQTGGDDAIGALANAGESDEAFPPHGNARRRAGTSVEAAQAATEMAMAQLNGQYILMLRRGHLLSLSHAAPFRVVSQVALAPLALGDRHDGLLVSKDLVLVVGLRTNLSSLELSQFRVDSVGGLHHVRTFWLRGRRDLGVNEYAARLRGGQLQMYLPVPALDGDALQRPALREGSEAFQDLPGSIHGGLQPGAIVHAAVTCDLTNSALACRAVSILGPEAAIHHVSDEGILVWADEAEGSPASPVLYRLPFGSELPSALRMQGRPVDGLSFGEGADGVLRVLVWLRGAGLHTESETAARDELALVRVPPHAFAQSVVALQGAAYKRLPMPGGTGSLRARFVAGRLLYGTAAELNTDQTDDKLYLCDATRGDALSSMPLGHSVERIDAVAGGALIAGRSERDLVLTSVDLGKRVFVDRERVADDPARGELDVLGIFAAPSARSESVIALPSYEAPTTSAGQAVTPSATVFLLRERSLQLERVAQLRANANGS
ncbi:MAG TPA: hypothetical protein VMF89_13115, partial [Polyangiales bacterium]|nr:hypothetical protein [Polyangiales bacterium]